jgi:hypothetical protein
MRAEAGAVEPAYQGEDVLLGASAHERVRKVEDRKRAGHRAP